MDIGKNKKISLEKDHLKEAIQLEDRKQLVGVVPLDKSQFIDEGQHVVECENLQDTLKHQ